MKKFLPMIVVAVFAAWIVYTLVPRETGAFHLREFGKLPVLLNGRVQPFDSVGRNALRQLRNNQQVYLGDGKYLQATEWLLEVMAKPETADGHKVFRIDNDEVKSLLKLPVDEKFFSFTQVEPSFDELEKQGRRIGDIESAQRSAFESQTYKLYGAVLLYQRLKVTLRPPGTDDFAAELAEFQAVAPAGAAAARLQQMGRSYDTNAFETLVGFLARYNRASQFGYALCVPPVNPEHTRDDWKNMGMVLMESARGEALPPAVPELAAMMTAFRKNDATGFNQAVANYQKWLDEKMVPEVRKGRQEYAFNFFDPFYKSTVIYVWALLAALTFWFAWAEWLRKSAYNLVWLAFILHTLGLLARMYLERRPPVTNLYSSAIFIGWGSVILGLILERIHRDGIGSVVAAVVGFVTQIIALNLALGGDTMEMMRAVLDSNFWLATHVITITLGYSAMFVAGILAIIYILRGVFTSSLKQESAMALGRMVYGVTCFATLFSFVGTVLGGIWADQSWGRFWGWDPKENGALLIVIWCAVILHARWGGLARDRGVMNMAIIGNIITAWSWFGVNMLGVGLHSYGFMDSAFKWLVLFIATQVAIIGIGMLPLPLWRSFKGVAQEPPQPPDDPAPAPAS
jgi:ABC-type transport system involved in cytochrome c biogenesis permease subunit